jgi:methylated-DNA-[protein]-cysteine S-methyltransferase
MAFALFPTAFGKCAVAWNEVGLTRFQLPAGTDLQTQQRLGGDAGFRIDEDEAPEWVRLVIKQVRKHLAGEVQDFSAVRLDRSRATSFQLGVYGETLGIKPGQTKSYGEIAGALGLGNAAARAVGIALATNPWPLVVPCHRVVAADGKMTGFSAPGGVRTKTRLLALEGAELLSE